MVDRNTQFVLDEYRAQLIQLNSMQERLLQPKSHVKKIGLDIHGVIDRDPKFLADQARTLISCGHEVHIMTGSQVNPALVKSLKSLWFEKGKQYTSLFSVTDHLIDTGIPVEFRDGYPFADPLLWNAAKGEYALLNGLDALWDDSPAYGRYMPASCWYFTYSIDNFESQLDQVLNGGRPKIGRT